MKERAARGLVAERLDYLFRTVVPEGGKPYTHAEVAGAINAAAGERLASTTYVWQLRTGHSDNPTYKVLVGLARFFGVSPAYFFDEADTARGEVPAEVAVALRSEGVREIATSAAGLSGQSLRAVRQLIASARELEGQGQPGVGSRSGSSRSGSRSGSRSRGGGRAK
ncbi:MAG: transcriptional regulator [Nocardiopsaceae bacterium]|nr:transcriptional regulator [Nocardiopsaceae bacterium]